MDILSVTSIHLYFFYFKCPQLSTVAADPFTSRLFDIYEKVWEQGNAEVSTERAPYPTPPQTALTATIFRPSFR